MGFSSLPMLVLGLLTPQLITALVIQPRDVDCGFRTAANPGDTCASFSAQWHVTLADFEALNPEVTCPDLVWMTMYCLSAYPTNSSSSAITTIFEATPSAASTTTASSPLSSTSTTSSTTSSITSNPPVTVISTTSTATTTTGNGVSIASPTKSGMATAFRPFHLVISGDLVTSLLLIMLLL